MKDAGPPTTKPARGGARRAASSRRRELLGGAAFGAAALAVGSPDTALGASSDVMTLGSLLRIERRLAALYDAALRKDLLPAPLARTLRDQEREHARGLERGLAGLGARPPAGTPALPPLPDRARFPAFALRFEDEAVAAYVDAIATLRRPGLLQPLGSIAASEGQHQVILRQLADVPALS